MFSHPSINCLSTAIPENVHNFKQLIYIHHLGGWESNYVQAIFTISSDGIEYDLIMLLSFMYITANRFLILQNPAP